jgi:hypothetical protein
VVAARGWLERHFSAAKHPGLFASEREELRNAAYYYWTWAVAHAFRIFQTRRIVTDRGELDWAAALAAELLARQRPDGSWVNRFTDAKEDDPLIATPWAASASALARALMNGRLDTLFPSSGPGRSPGHPHP